MPGSNLTRDEAAERAALLEVESYDITLDLTDGASGPGKETFRSRSEVRFRTRQAGASTFIDLVAATVHSVTLNGEQLAVTDGGREHRIVLPELAEHNTLVIDADCRYMNTGEGLHRFVDPVDNKVYLYSQCEARDAHRIYAGFDQPDLKAPFTFHITAAPEWSVISNAPVEREETTPAGAKTSHYAPTPRISTYLTAVVGGEYHAVRDEHRGLPLAIYCRQSLASYLDPDDIFTVTKQGLNLFNEKFAYPYPFPKYDQLFVPEFNAGAMENPGAVTFSEELVFRSKVTQLRYEGRANTILHEMAHMWFGDLVTMKWWDDLWLNESFAEWAGHWASVTATKYTEGWTTFCIQRKGWGYRQDQLSSTHPVAVDAPDVASAEANFDGITYAKGASVLKQLVAYVGEETFLAAIRSYFPEHAFANATLADLLGALEKASGRNLDAWAQAWLQTTGVNTLRPEYTVDESGRFTSFAIRQEATTEHPTLRPHRLAIGLYARGANGVLTRKERLEVDIAGPLTPIETMVGRERPALILLNDDDLTYAKIRLDEHSMQSVITGIATMEGSLARALCWAAAWDMTRDGELPTREYLRLTINGLPAESAAGVVQVQLNYLLRALELYAEPGWARHGFTELADTAWQTAIAAAPGSDLQLVWLRAFASAARSGEQLSTVRELLDGERELGGLTIDTELRWHLLGNLVASGMANEATIQAELSRDATDRGQRHAATLRALIPSVEAKAEAWRQITEETALPNQTVLSILRGFADPSHAELLERYVERYFDAAKTAWAERTSKVAENIADLLYPLWAVEPETVRLTDAYLAEHPELPAPLRRAMIEGKDAVVRAIKARKCDAGA